MGLLSQCGILILYGVEYDELLAFRTAFYAQEAYNSAEDIHRNMIPHGFSDFGHYTHTVPGWALESVRLVLLDSCVLRFASIFHFDS